MRLRNGLMLAALRTWGVLTSASCYSKAVIMFLNFTCKASRLLCPCYSQQSRPFLRSISAIKKGTGTPRLHDKSEHRLVYELPHVQFVAGILRTKKHLPIVAVLFAPVLYAFDKTGTSSLVTVAAAGCLFVTALAITAVSKNVVGKIYVNKNIDVKDVMISSLDAFGRRVDRIHNLDEIINVDSPTKISEALGFIRLHIENSDVFYNVNIKNCRFIDIQACSNIIGVPESEILKKTDELQIKKDLQG